jgi:hypothetical protein
MWALFLKIYLIIYGVTVHTHTYYVVDHWVVGKVWNSWFGPEEVRVCDAIGALVTTMFGFNIHVSVLPIHSYVIAYFPPLPIRHMSGKIFVWSILVTVKIIQGTQWQCTECVSGQFARTILGQPEWWVSGFRTSRAVPCPGPVVDTIRQIIVNPFLPVIVFKRIIFKIKKLG